VSPKEIPSYLARADVFVRASRSEGLGSSFLEAMAAGVPVIGTPVGGIPDFLKEGETGLFSRSDDPQNLAEKIAELLANAPLRRRLVQNGKVLVRSRYSWEHIVQEMEKYFLRSRRGRELLLHRGFCLLK
jgi:Glycosyltransferase